MTERDEVAARSRKAIRDRARARWAFFTQALAGRWWSELLALILPFADVYHKILLPFGVLLVIFFVSLLWQEGVLEDLAQQVANRWAPAGGEKIVIVTVDDQTLAAVAPETDSRKFLTTLVDRLAEARPRVVGLDYVFLSALGGARDAERPDSTRRDAALPPRVEPAGRAVPIVVGSVTVRRGQERVEVVPDSVLADPPLMNWGHTSVEQSRDAGQIRTLKIHFGGDEGGPIPSFSLAVWAAGQGMSGTALREELRVCQEAPPGSGGDESRGCRPDLFRVMGERRIRFVARDDAFEEISAARLLDGRFRPGSGYYERITASLAGRYVLVGATHLQARDKYPTPLATRLPLLSGHLGRASEDGLLPGVFIHGYALHNILTRTFVRPASPAVSVVLVVLAVLVPAVTFLLTAVRRWLLADEERRRRWTDALWIAGATLVTGLLMFSYAVYAMVTRLETVALGLAIPILLTTLLVVLVARAYIRRVERSTHAEIFGRHATRYLDGSELGYHELLGTHPETLAIAVHRPYRPEIEAPADFAKALGVIQRRLAEELDPPRESGILPIVDNWGFNRAALYLHCARANGGAGRREAALRLALPRMIRLAETGPRENLGPLTVAIGWGEVLITEIASRCEQGVLTMCGELLDELARRAEPRPDGKTLVVLFDLSDLEPLIRELAAGYRIEPDAGTDRLLYVKAA